MPQYFEDGSHVRIVGDSEKRVVVRHAEPGDVAHTGQVLCESVSGPRWVYEQALERWQSSPGVFVVPPPRLPWA
jgi:hypothetical protein